LSRARGPVWLATRCEGLDDDHAAAAAAEPSPVDCTAGRGGLFRLRRQPLRGRGSGMAYRKHHLGLSRFISSQRSSLATPEFRSPAVLKYRSNWIEGTQLTILSLNPSERVQRVPSSRGLRQTASDRCWRTRIHRGSIMRRGSMPYIERAVVRSCDSL
jgi:hypothetical protein